MKERFGLTVDWQPPDSASHKDLAEDELHLWWFPLQLSSKQSESAMQLLSDVQKNKYHRRRSQNLKQAYLAGRYYLLNLIGHYTRTPTNKVLLSYSELNKPFLSSPEFDLQFNLSDTRIGDDHYGAFAFCKSRAVGVDIEWLQRKANFKGIAASRYSDEEQAYVACESGGVSGQRSLAVWTRKEAFGKALGKGINYKMNALNLVNDGDFEVGFVSHQEHWRLKQIQLEHDVIACVAHQGDQALKVKAFNWANHFP